MRSAWLWDSWFNMAGSPNLSVCGCIQVLFFLCVNWLICMSVCHISLINTQCISQQCSPRIIITHWDSADLLQHLDHCLYNTDECFLGNQGLLYICQEYTQAVTLMSPPHHMENRRETDTESLYVMQAFDARMGLTFIVFVSQACHNLSLCYVKGTVHGKL